MQEVWGFWGRRIVSRRPSEHRVRMISYLHYEVIESGEVSEDDIRPHPNQLQESLHQSTHPLTVPRFYPPGTHFWFSHRWWLFLFLRTPKRVCGFFFPSYFFYFFEVMDCLKEHPRPSLCCSATSKSHHLTIMYWRKDEWACH